MEDIFVWIFGAFALIGVGGFAYFMGKRKERDLED